MPTCKCTKKGNKLCKNRKGQWRFKKGKCHGKGRKGRKGRKTTTRRRGRSCKVKHVCKCKR